MGKLSIEKVWIWPVALLVAIIPGIFMDFSQVPWVAQIMGIEGMDRWAHGAYLGLLCVLLSRKLEIWKVILAGVVVSVGIEVGQAFTPTRQPDVWDATAGIIGAWVGWGVYQIRFIKNLFEAKIGLWNLKKNEPSPISKSCASK